MNTNDLIYFGIILDPCFRMRFFEYNLPQMYNDQPKLAEVLITKVKTDWSKCLKGMLLPMSIKIGIGHLLVVHHGCQWLEVVFQLSI
jgi:hypothetical protein